MCVQHTGTGDPLGGVGQITLDYDHLVVATGCKPATYGTPGVEENAFFMKEIKDAQKIRDHVANCLETASVSARPSPKARPYAHAVRAARSCVHARTVVLMRMWLTVRDNCESHSHNPSPLLPDLNASFLGRHPTLSPAFCTSWW